MHRQLARRLQLDLCPLHLPNHLVLLLGLLAAQLALERGVAAVATAQLAPKRRALLDPLAQLA